MQSCVVTSQTLVQSASLSPHAVHFSMNAGQSFFVGVVGLSQLPTALFPSFSQV
jgi:hypothetical protein